MAGYFLTFDDAWDLVVSWPYALVAYQGGAVDPLRVINVSDPSRPTLTGSTLLPDWPWGIVTDDYYCYVSCLDSGIRIYDISNPGIPTEVGYHLTPSWALGPDVEGSFIYLASDYAGLGIYENELLAGVNGPDTPDVARPTFPTVMRLGVLARFAGRILDIQGRDVTGKRGALSPGIYFLRPAAGGPAAVRKIIAQH